jgi:hypothetical protein
MISVAGTFGHFYLGDPYDWTDAIVEELSPSTYLEIWGYGGLPVDESPIAGALSYGGFEYCISSTSPVRDDGTGVRLRRSAAGFKGCSWSGGNGRGARHYFPGGSFSSRLNCRPSKYSRGLL